MKIWEFITFSNSKTYSSLSLFRKTILMPPGQLLKQHCKVVSRFLKPSVLAGGFWYNCVMPDDFLLAYASFNADNQPFIDCQIGDEIKRRELFGQDLSLEFDFSTKYCTGWVDFDNHCSQICPDSATVDGKYENCLKCRDRTGFNPAFYNAEWI